MGKEKASAFGKSCKHDLQYSYGDNVSTTGPTGIFEYCTKCDRRKLVGESGAMGDRWYHLSEDAPRPALRFGPSWKC